MGIGQELVVLDVSKNYGTFKALEDINLTKAKKVP